MAPRDHHDRRDGRGPVRRAGDPRHRPADPPIRLRELRAALGPSQEKLARRLGVSFATVNRWETGRNPISERAAVVLRELAQQVRAPAAASDLPEAAAGRQQPRSEFVGRERELDRLRVLASTNRLLCLVGPGGVGKTRLAVELARSFEPELPTTFVELGPIRDPRLVSASIAVRLGARDRPGVTGAQALSAAVGTEPRLLVLDDAEQVRDAVADVAAELLAEAPELRILVTSRRALGALGERTWLAVFAGPFTLGDTHAVTGIHLPELIHSIRALAEASWLQMHGDGPENRFVLLESIRAYAARRQAASVGSAGSSGSGGSEGSGVSGGFDDDRALRERHARHFASLAVESENGLTTPDAANWLARMDACWPDVEQALAWTRAEGESELGLDAAAGLWRWWLTTGRLAEGRAWLDCMLAAPHDRAGPSAARALHRLGRVGEAVKQQRDAEAVAVEIGHTTHLASVRSALAEVGELSRIPPPAGVTPREAEVLGLLGRGMTNRQIAAELYLSVSTVERHLATVYRKLGLRGRVEAARYAVANGLAPTPH